MRVNYGEMKKYLRACREDADLSGGRAAGLPDSDFDSTALDVGTKIEKEHTKDPDIAKEIAKDHLEEHVYYYDALPPMEDMLEKIEEKAACTRHDAYRIILRAAAKEGQFYKNIPLETKQFIDKNPERAKEFFKGKEHLHPEIMEYLRNLTQSPRENIAQNIAAMKSELNPTVVGDPNSLKALLAKMTGNAEADWKVVELAVSPKLIKYLRGNTMLSPQNFLNGLLNFGGDLGQIITPDTLI